MSMPTLLNLPKQMTRASRTTQLATKDVLSPMPITHRVKEEILPRQLVLCPPQAPHCTHGTFTHRQMREGREKIDRWQNFKILKGRLGMVPHSFNSSTRSGAPG